MGTAEFHWQSPAALRQVPHGDWGEDPSPEDLVWISIHGLHAAHEWKSKPALRHRGDVLNGNLLPRLALTEKVFTDLIASRRATLAKVFAQKASATK